MCLLFICIFSLILLQSLAGVEGSNPAANQRPVLRQLTNQSPDSYQVGYTPSQWSTNSLNRLFFLIHHKHIIIMNTCFPSFLSTLSEHFWFWHFEIQYAFWWNKNIAWQISWGYPAPFRCLVHYMPLLTYQVSTTHHPKCSLCVRRVCEVFGSRAGVVVDLYTSTIRTL